MAEITFSEVKTGQRFFDFESGEFWIKLDEEFATIDSGFSFDESDDDCEAEDFFNEPDVDRFEADEIVDVD